MTYAPNDLRADKDSVGDNTPVVLTHDGVGAFEFLFFCWNATEQVGRFAKAVEAAVKKTPSELLDPQVLSATLRDPKIRKLLVKAYLDVTDGLNWTTLCLQASPISTRTHLGSYLARRGMSPTALQEETRLDLSPMASIGWLGTGDLELANPHVGNAFFARRSPRRSCCLSILAASALRLYPRCMVASARVRQILSEVRDLSDDEKAELEAELFAEDAATGRAWGEEVDRRAARVLAGEVSGIARDELRSLFAMPPAEARTRLAALLDARK